MQRVLHYLRLNRRQLHQPLNNLPNNQTDLPQTNRLQMVAVETADVMAVLDRATITAGTTVGIGPTIITKNSYEA